jgi:hypothetical protein
MVGLEVVSILGKSMKYDFLDSLGDISGNNSRSLKMRNLVYFNERKIPPKENHEIR